MAETLSFIFLSLLSGIAVTAVDSGMRALQYLGLVEDQRSSVDASFLQFIFIFLLKIEKLEALIISY